MKTSKEGQEFQTSPTPHQSHEQAFISFLYSPSMQTWLYFSLHYVVSHQTLVNYTQLELGSLIIVLGRDFKWSLCLIVTETVLLSASPTAATISCVIETILHIYRSRASVQRALHMLSPTASRQSYKVGSEVQCDGKAMYRAVAQKLPPVQPKRQAKKGNAGGFAN